MATLTMSEIQKNYTERKEKSGWKRIQIWKLDEKNKDIQAKIKLGAQLINQSTNEKQLIDELTKYNDEMLKDITW